MYEPHWEQNHHLLSMGNLVRNSFPLQTQGLPLDLKQTEELLLVITLHFFDFQPGKDQLSFSFPKRPALVATGERNIWLARHETLCAKGPFAHWVAKLRLHEASNSHEWGRDCREEAVLNTRTSWAGGSGISNTRHSAFLTEIGPSCWFHEGLRGENSGGSQNPNPG